MYESNRTFLYWETSVLLGGVFVRVLATPLETCHLWYVYFSVDSDGVRHSFQLCCGFVLVLVSGL